MKDFIEIGDKKYRVAANMNAIRDYGIRTGNTDLSKIGDVLTFPLDSMGTMAHCCIKEGERLEGREFNLSELDLGAEMLPVHMLEFARVYTRQVTAGLKPDNVTGTKKKLGLFR